MSFISPHPRNPDVRAARPAVAIALALTLAIGVAGWVLFRNRPGRRRDAGWPARSVVGEPAGDAIDRSETTAVEGEAVATGGDPAADKPGDEGLLAALNHLEARIDAAMARARESVVTLEYTAGAASGGERRAASGVVINHRCDILSIRIDPPPRDPAVGSARGTTGNAGRRPLPIVARDFLGRGHTARWVASDPLTGLTLLRVAPRAVRPVRPAAEGPKLVSQVFVVGNPFGLGHTVNRGHVAGLDRVLELGRQPLGGLIQVQVPLYPGDSGAAVVDIRGHWLGVIRGGLAVPVADARAADLDKAAGPTPARRTDGGDLAHDTDDVEPDSDFGFAIPTRDALWVADQLRAHGRVDRAYLGVVLEKMPVSDGPIADAEPSAPARVAVPGSSPTESPSPPEVAGAWRGWRWRIRVFIRPDRGAAGGR